MLNRIPASLAALCVAALGLVAASSCVITPGNYVCNASSPVDTACPCLTSGDPRARCTSVQTTGSIGLTWVVNGQPAATACGPANAANVRISLAGAAPALEPCQSGTKLFAGLAAGSLTVQADLIDAAGNVLNSYPSSPQTVVVGATTNVAIMFNVGGGGAVGGVKFNWTVGGQPAATACPAGSMVKFESTAQPSTAATSTVACNAGTMEIANLPAGAYTFRGSLLNGAAAPSLIEGITAMVNAGSVLEFSPAVDFPAAGATQTGAAVLSWTVNYGQKCLASAPMEITVSGGPTTPSPQPSGTCGTYTMRVADLAVGTYSFKLAIPNPTAGQPVASVDIPGIAVTAGADNAVPVVNITCAFCPQ